MDTPKSPERQPTPPSILKRAAQSILKKQPTPPPKPSSPAPPKSILKKPTTVVEVATPQSPDQVMQEDTPMSPEPEIDDTPASPTPKSPEVEPESSESKENPKVIPLERDPRQLFMRKKSLEASSVTVPKPVPPPAAANNETKFDIRAPKDWHRGLRTHQPSSSASPSSECSDDSDRGSSLKKLQIVESSPASISSSPASPASGESVMNKPPSSSSAMPLLPTPVPSSTSVALPTPIPSEKSKSPVPSHQIPTDRKKSEVFPQPPRMHPSRPPRPVLIDPPKSSKDPSFARHNSMSQPRLNQQAYQSSSSPNVRPQMMPTGQTQQFRPMHPNMMRPERPPEQKRPLTYGEYRKLREQQMQMQHQRHHQHQKQHQQQQQQQPVQEQQPVMSRRDPRRPPSKPEQTQKSKEEPSGSASSSATSGASSSSSSSLGKFKIPKKKKQPEQHDWLFKPDEVKKKPEKFQRKSNVHEKSVQPSKESAPVEKSSNSANEKSAPAIEKPSKPSKPAFLSGSDRESDSEPELKIAESDDEGQKEPSEIISPPPAVEAKPDVQESKTSESEVKDKEKEEKERGQLTKAMLQNIVASIDTKEASKLLERATRLLNSDDGHKLSLKQLLVGDSDSEEEESSVKQSAKKKTSEEPSKASAKKAPAKKPPKAKPTPTPGTRRSRRLQQPESENEPTETKEDTTENEATKPPVDDDDDDDDENQLVIDEAIPDQEIESPAKVSTTPTPAPARKGRGRPPKVSKSAPVVESKTVVNDDDMTYDKVDDEDSESKPLLPKTRMTRMMGRMAPKSKTWFPNRDEASKPKRVLRSPTPNTSEIKREPKDPDMKVFGLSEDTVILESFMPESVKVKTESSEKKNEVASRLEKLREMMNKLNQSPQSSESEEKSLSETPEVRKNEPNEKSVLDNTDLDVALKEPLPEIVFAQSSRKSPVKNRFNNVNEDVEEEVANDKDFVEVVKSIIHDQSEQSEVESIANQFPDLSKAESKGFKSLASHFGNKHPSLIQEMMQNVSDLFKCMAYSCSYTCTLAQDFKIHLYEVHSIDKNKNRHGWLKCCYCQRKLANPECLTNHVIKVHSSAPYQCQNCFHRDSSQWSLLIHQYQSHPGSDQGYIQVQTMEKSIPKSSLPPYSASAKRGFSCQESQCTVQAGSPDELAHHLFVDHSNAKAFNDYQCAHCLQTFNSVPRLVIHLKLAHMKKLSPNMIIRKIQQSLTIDSEGT